jgi:multidrug efflux pump subunit AcrA (membrane-fusion protein)
MTRLAEPGAKLMAASDHPQSAQAVRLYDPKRLQVRVDVPLADAARVSAGQEAKVVVHVLPDREFRGKVTRISGEADLAKNTLQVKVAVVDPSPELRPEMLTRVKFVAPATTSSTKPSQIVFAPEHLLVRDGDAAKVWVVDPKRGVATLQSIQPGETRHNGWVSVRSGLQAGDQLIADPAGLTAGKKVKVVGEAAAAQPALSTEHSALSREGGSHGVH